MAVIRTEHRSDELDRASIVYFLIVKLIYTEHLFVSALILSWFFRTPATQKRQAKILITPPPLIITTSFLPFFLPHFSPMAVFGFPLSLSSRRAVRIQTESVRMTRCSFTSPGYFVCCRVFQL